jgi:cytidylate kinase
MENKIIVAIDGYSSCGKSTIAKALAKYAGYTYVDTGAMYRAAALYALRAGIENNLSDIEGMLKDIRIGFVKTILNTQKEKTKCPLTNII